MFEDMTTLEIFKLLAPLLFIQFGLTAYCVYDIMKKGVRNLSKTIWLLIVILPNTVTAICYLTLGKKRWGND